MQIFRKKNINLPYHQHNNYWIIVFSIAGSFSPSLINGLQVLGYRNSADDICIAQTGEKWNELWQKTYELLQKYDATNKVEITLTADDSMIDGSGERKSVAAIQNISQSLWLGDAIRDDRLMCYFQPIVNCNSDKESSKNFGYESFVRARGDDGNIIGGGDIIQASRAMQIEYMVDKMLHVQAIKTFAASNNTGFLFVNFFTGFIQRPEVYLEGLRETARTFGIVPKNLAIEFANNDKVKDIKHLKNVCDYAKIQGYSIALDDVTDPISAQNLVDSIRPDFVKLDCQHLGNLSDNQTRSNIRQIIEISQTHGCSIIAEGVEDEENFLLLRGLGIRLFQGYYFSAPAPLQAE